MKKILSRAIALVLVLSVASGVSVFAATTTQKSAIIIIAPYNFLPDEPISD